MRPCCVANLLDLCKGSPPSVLFVVPLIYQQSADNTYETDQYFAVIVFVSKRACLLFSENCTT